MARYFQRRHGPASFPAWLGIGLVLLLATADATACPACYRARVLESYWHFKLFAVLVGAPLLVTFTRLDVVRVLYTFIPLALVTIKLQSFILLEGYPGTYNDAQMALISNLCLAASLAAPILICCLGKFAFFRRDGQKGFLIWQPFAYCGLLFMAQPYLRV